VIEIQSRIKGEYEKMVITSEQAHSLTLTEWINESISRECLGMMSFNGHNLMVLPLTCQNHFPQTTKGNLAMARYISVCSLLHFSVIPDSVVLRSWVLYDWDNFLPNWFVPRIVYVYYCY
jgi:hypothetical protein